MECPYCGFNHSQKQPRCARCQMPIEAAGDQPVTTTDQSLESPSQLDGSLSVNVEKESAEPAARGEESSLETVVAEECSDFSMASDLDLQALGESSLTEADLEDESMDDVSDLLDPILAGGEDEDSAELLPLPSEMTIEEMGAVIGESSFNPEHGPIRAAAPNKYMPAKDELVQPPPPPEPPLGARDPDADLRKAAEDISETIKRLKTSAAGAKDLARSESSGSASLTDSLVEAGETSLADVGEASASELSEFPPEAKSDSLSLGPDIYAEADELLLSSAADSSTTGVDSPSSIALKIEEVEKALKNNEELAMGVEASTTAPEPSAPLEDFMAEPEIPGNPGSDTAELNEAFQNALLGEAAARSASQLSISGDAFESMATRADEIFGGQDEVENQMPAPSERLDDFFKPEPGAMASKESVEMEPADERSLIEIERNPKPGREKPEVIPLPFDDSLSGVTIDEKSGGQDPRGVRTLRARKPSDSKPRRELLLRRAGAGAFDLAVWTALGLMLLGVGWALVGTKDPGASAWAAAAPVAVMTFFFAMIYGGVFGTVSGGTPGMMIFGLRMVGMEGQRPGPTGALIRTALFLARTAPLGLGLLPSLIIAEDPADKISGLKVIKA